MLQLTERDVGFGMIGFMLESYHLMLLFDEGGFDVNPMVCWIFSWQKNQNDALLNKGGIAPTVNDVVTVDPTILV
jgi:hypothetical protein